MDRSDFEKKYGRVWNTDELKNDFDVVAFMAPFVEVKRKEDGQKGLLVFNPNPRYYFRFVPLGKL